MKFKFIQKKGVVVALATALAVGSFGITAFANGAGIRPSELRQSDQSNQNNQGTSGSSGPSYSGGGGGGGAATTKPEKEPEKGPENTSTATITKDADGSMKLVDSEGKAVVNAKVTIGGKSYVSGTDGKVITSAFATTPKGNKVFCGADGAIVKNKTFKADGKKYLASKTGKIITGKITKTPKGNLVYCTKTGAIKTNGIFKADGKKYIAKKSGALYTNCWVTVGNTKYFCNKKGVVTKTKVISSSKK